MARNNQLREYWLACYLVTSALLGGYLFQMQAYYRPLIKLLIGIYVLISLGILFFNNTFLTTHIRSEKHIYYNLIQKLNKTYPHLPQNIFTSGWFEARKLFFIKNQPNVYTLGCGSLTNQYTFWSEDALNQIKNKTLKEAWFIDDVDQKKCLKGYFDTCVRMPTESYKYDNKEYSLFLYRCMNN
jgi:hypothetical protein